MSNLPGAGRSCGGGQEIAGPWLTMEEEETPEIIDPIRLAEISRDIILAKRRRGCTMKNECESGDPSGLPPRPPVSVPHPEVPSRWGSRLVRSGSLGREADPLPPGMTTNEALLA